MRKIIDIYGHFRKVDEMYNKDNSWYGRIIVNEDSLFEGIVSSYDEDNTSFVFGTVDEDTIYMTQCPRNESMYPKELIVENKNRKYRGVSSQISREEEPPLEECKIVLIPAEKTREESSYELERLDMRLEIIKSELPQRGKELYQIFQTENKPIQKAKK